MSVNGKKTKKGLLSHLCSERFHVFHHLAELAKEQMAKATKNAIFAESWHWQGAAFQDTGAFRVPAVEHEVRAASVLGGTGSSSWEEMSPQFLLECHQPQPCCANTG